MADQTAKTGNTIPPIALEDRDVHHDGRLYSPSASRNKEAVFQVVAPLLGENAAVLEIGSGTGEHAALFCERLPGIKWQPSDPDERSRKSIAAWSEQAAHRNLAKPLDLMTSHPGWHESVLEALARPAELIFSMNMIHISPWASCVGLFSGARHILSADGSVYLYGPFLEGSATAASNLAFDESLRARNSDWGVRPLDEVVACAADYGFALRSRIEMPANNLSLFFDKLV